ncbi:FecR family protein [Novosphingobium beihaiensis]|uniref:FecR domain-containing protein n=1 Tax=Novosphingobium beihaiensis TaxID=2930389 RepID=A0ABT0BUR7_9SPHN|nr:FecR domain-containing protein [Novosphingobium beihaiensis]MCJ2188817.1 FecR domain-containing protein [Novosphingobium beihaiensis]
MSADAPNGKSPAFEAANWLILLAEEPVAEEVRAAFAAWLGASPANRRAWAAATETYDAIGHAPQFQPGARHSSAARSGGSRKPGRIAHGRQGGKPRKRALIAAAVAACLVVVAAPSLWLRVSADRITGTAELATMTLDDGSRVYLGPDSAISVAYSAGERKVDLLSGEASFDVAPNPARPFRVKAGDIRTTVLGTAFEIRRERTGTWVAVAHGRVRVRVDGRGDGPAIRRVLTGGDWLRVDKDRQVEHGSGAGDDSAPGRAMVVVKDRPVAEVIDRLRPWYDGIIILTDAEMGRQRVTGAYDPRDPEKALSLLLSAHGGAIRRITPWLILVSKSG